MVLLRKCEERLKAKAAGHKFYSTGIPCVHGHEAKRYTSNKNCVECIKKRMLKNFYDNKEKHRVRMKRYREANKDSLKEKRQQNKKRRLIANVKWQKKNIDKVKLYQRACRAKRKKSVGTHTDYDIRNIYKHQNGKCAECKKKLFNAYHVDHIMPLSRGGSNWSKNLQLLCAPCNISKNAFEPIEWAKKKGRLL